RDHLGVVDDDLVTGFEQPRQIAHRMVCQRSVGPHHQQPRSVARTCRPQRDAPGRQLEVEESGTHIRHQGSSVRYQNEYLIPDTCSLIPGHPASDFIRAETILSGLTTGSPRLMPSTFSIPSTTLPHTVYWPLRNGASSKQMKNWLSPESGFCARAMETVPR